MSGKLNSHATDANERTVSSPPPFIFTQSSSKHDVELPKNRAMTLLLSLTADERTKSRHYFDAQIETRRYQSQTSDLASDVAAPIDDKKQRCGIYLRLPRGTVLRHNDYLITDEGDAILRIMAKPEPVMTAIAPSPLDLLKAAYHLGNRHVELEVSLHYLRFSPDPVLKQMVECMGLSVTEAILPFQPEGGAYASHHHASHEHSGEL